MASALALAAAACDTEEPAALNEGAADNEMNAMRADPNNPFADAEMRMNDAMTAAVGTDAGDSWARKMVAHHQGANEMANVMLGLNPPADIAKMARDTIAKNDRDIADIRKLLKGGAPSPQSAELYRPAATAMHDAMMAARGADVRETFLRKMLEHHKGAVAMSDVALANGVGGALRTQVEKTRKMNQDDIKLVEAMLAGEPPAATTAATDPPPPSTSKATDAPRPSTPRAASKPPAPKPDPAPTKPTAPAPKPSAPECLPEHRAAGHC